MENDSFEGYVGSLEKNMFTKQCVIQDNSLVLKKSVEISIAVRRSLRPCKKN